jgi:Cytochrome C'
MRHGVYVGILLIGIWLLASSPNLQSGQTVKAAPKMEPVAETLLLMQGINLPNFQGIEKLLKEKPTEAEAWKFLRGQALLIAENGNLLMLRPPHNAGEAIWQEKAATMRTQATKLANVIAEGDFTRSRAGLIDLASACNDCHSSFRVAARVLPFSTQGEPRRARPAPATPSGPAPPKPDVGRR